MMSLPDICITIGLAASVIMIMERVKKWVKDLYRNDDRQDKAIVENSHRWLELEGRVMELEKRAREQGPYR